jgi:hypothetical protein
LTIHQICYESYIAVDYYSAIYFKGNLLKKQVIVEISENISVILNHRFWKNIMKINLITLLSTLSTLCLLITPPLFHQSLAHDHLSTEEYITPAGQQLTTLTGRIIKKPWSKTAESWNAGSSEYYVLDVGDAEIKSRSAEEGVILRSSERVSMEKFAEYVGKSVKVTGVYVPAMPYQPENPMESFPMDMNGQPLPRGSGFQVYSLTAL